MPTSPSPCGRSSRCRDIGVSWRPAPATADDLVKSLALAAYGELRLDGFHGGNDFWANAIHDDISVTLKQRHHRGDAIDSFALRRRLNQVDDRHLLVLSDRLENAPERVRSIWATIAGSSSAESTIWAIWPLR